MIFTLHDTGIRKELNLYNGDGLPLSEEDEALELAGSNNEIDRFLKTNKNADGTYHISAARYSWWRRRFAQVQAGRFRLEANVKCKNDRDLMKNFYHILQEEKYHYGNDHGDYRSLTERVLTRLRTIYE